MLEIDPGISPTGPDAQLANLINRGRRDFMAEAIREDHLGDLDLVATYSPRERVANLLRGSKTKIALFVGGLVLLYTIATTASPAQILSRNGEKQISATATVIPTEIPMVEPTPEWAIIADQILRTHRTPTPIPRGSRYYQSVDVPTLTPVPPWRRGFDGR